MQTPTQQRIHKGRDVKPLMEKKTHEDFPHVIYLSRNTNRVKDYGETDIYKRIIHETCRFRCVAADSSQQRKEHLCPDKMSDMT